jgi:hypothetical protein
MLRPPKSRPACRSARLAVASPASKLVLDDPLVRDTSALDLMTILTPEMMRGQVTGAKVPSSAGDEIPFLQWLTWLGTEMAKSQGSESIGPENAIPGS